MSYTNRYRAYLKRQLRDRCFPAHVDGPGFPVLKDGFWITKQGEFTMGEGKIHWVPPSQIIFIEKLNAEVDPHED